MEQRIKAIRENGVGYLYSWAYEETWPIGSQRDQELLPFEVLSSIQPISRLTAALNHIPSFHYLCKRRDNRQTDKEIKGNADNILFYHTPLNILDVALAYRDYDESRKEFGSGNYVSVATTDSEYLEMLKQRFLQPYFIHHRQYKPKSRREGYNTEFYMVGDLRHTANFMNLLVTSPESVKELIAQLTGAEEHPLNGYELRRNLVVYDTTKKLKKQVELIGWNN